MIARRLAKVAANPFRPSAHQIVDEWRDLKGLHERQIATVQALMGEIRALADAREVEP